MNKTLIPFDLGLFFLNWFITKSHLQWTSELFVQKVLITTFLLLFCHCCNKIMNSIYEKCCIMKDVLFANDHCWPVNWFISCLWQQDTILMLIVFCSITARTEKVIFNFTWLIICWFITHNVLSLKTRFSFKFQWWPTIPACFGFSVRKIFVFYDASGTCRYCCDFCTCSFMARAEKTISLVVF